MAHIVTVTGEIAPDGLGFTLAHEHLFADLTLPNYAPPEAPADAHLGSEPVSLANRDWVEQHWTSNRDNLVLDDLDLAVDELACFRQAGGSGIVEVTPEGVGRDPARLVEASERSGVLVIMGSGYYVDVTHPASLAQRSESDITGELVRDCTVGVGTSGIRAGVIGEIGCSWPLTPREAAVLRAAGAAQREVGCALYVHPGRNEAAPRELLDILDSTGAALDRVVLCHVERTIFERDHLKDIAASGCYLEFDLFGMRMNAYFERIGIQLPDDDGRLDLVSCLVDAGAASQILMSHDIVSKHRLHRFGGHGYDHIPAVVVPAMRERRLGEADIRKFTVDNPRRALQVD
jgi:phosphotriesterase-related protein